MTDNVPDPAILAALLNDEQRRLYRSSSSFFHGINVLVAMLPSWIAGMELSARSADAQRELQIRAATGRL